MLYDVPAAALNTPGLPLARELERGRIVHFPQCPIPLPPEEDLRFLREELGQYLGRKNVSWYPDGKRLVGVKAPPDVRARARSILTIHAREVQLFLSRLMPEFMRDAHLGISSFRPVQERGRQLSAHASNELVHVDAGAYGATHGDRILRFFINVNPVEERVWASRGTFAELYRRYGAEAGLPVQARSLAPNPFEWLFSHSVRAGARVIPSLRMIDTSPYDRLMRRFHNFMKDTPSFRNSREGLEQFSFQPFSAWMVLTDSVSHACLSGQHALVDTLLIPVANCTEPAETPLQLLAGSAPGLVLA